MFDLTGRGQDYAASDGPSDAAGDPGDRLQGRLRDVLRQAAASQQSGAAPSAAVRAGLHAVCADARRLGVGPARLLVMLKGAWRSQPARAELADWLRSEAALERVVTVCIQEYYRPE